MEKDLETDATAEGGASVSAGSTNARITYSAPDGSHYVVNTTGKAPQMQIGPNNTMYVVDNTYVAGKKNRPKPNKKNKYPIMTNTEIPGTEAMDIIASNIGRDWRALGRKLGLSDGDLDNVRIDYYTEGQYEVSYQMVRKWKQLMYPTQVQQLAVACQYVGRGDISDKLALAYRDEDSS